MLDKHPQTENRLILERQKLTSISSNQLVSEGFAAQQRLVAQRAHPRLILPDHQCVRVCAFTPPVQSDEASHRLQPLFG